MDEYLSIQGRWAIVFFASLLLWIVPVSMQAPPLAVLLSFVAAIGGFCYAALIASHWKNSARVSRRRQTLDQELEAFQFGLEEESIKQQLLLQYFPQTEPAAVAVAEPRSLPQAKPNPAIEAFISWLCNRAVPKASVREVQRANLRALKGYKSSDIHQIFMDAQEEGHGVYSDGVFYHKSLIQE